jgi:hypothetical protein
VKTAIGRLEAKMSRQFERYKGSSSCKPGWVTCGDREECWSRGAGGPALDPNLATPHQVRGFLYRHAVICCCKGSQQDWDYADYKCSILPSRGAEYECMCMFFHVNVQRDPRTLFILHPSFRISGKKIRSFLSCFLLYLSSSKQTMMYAPIVKFEIDVS